jgi:alpha-tubulin suppressor-like RCC1 family protein
VDQVSAGGQHSCVLLEDQSIKCWGNNSSGQLGDGTTVNRLSPVAVVGITNAVSVSVGGNSTCALLSDKTIKCWGNNSSGQLGDATFTRRLTPVLVSGITNAISVSKSYNHMSNENGFACALLEDKTIKCWGDNSAGQFGNGNTSGRSIPVLVSGISDAVSVSVGFNHVCALLGDKTIKCWGYNASGQLGNGQLGAGTIVNGTPITWQPQLTPTLVTGISTAVSVFSRNVHSCALLLNKTVKCWGFNDSGQLGDGTTSSRSSPVLVSGVTNAVLASVGGYSTFYKNIVNLIEIKF